MISLSTFAQWPPPPPENCGGCTACCVIAGIPELGKPFYARCVHLGQGCGIYEQRPTRCSDFRCIWHLGILGTRVDRRPDHCGVMFQFEPFANVWHLGVYEITPGAANTEKTRYLIGIILKSKQIQHLPMGDPPVNIYPYGSDISINYPLNEAFEGYVSGEDKMRRVGSTKVYDGNIRAVIEPKKTPASQD